MDELELLGDASIEATEKIVAKPRIGEEKEPGSTLTGNGCPNVLDSKLGFSGFLEHWDETIAGDGNEE